ncbi:hypothetical protein LTR56_010013 [Elasticomyces elasticus]|nr:hypothetical protein LTR56_010013 [Elasticomyces elasticus]KAK3665048.1 hypothetical protein LTR22_004103 [Elasticomyces elasticus]KAK4931575.1 hypothetical protein LTR49_001964 [Elasticomyces elasticus]KAK5766735.1 hypothetical protein LTS12_003085 [Elasticomyces elasticus]
MAPQPPTKHSRASLSAKDPRGIYAPPISTSTSESTSTSTSHATTPSTPHPTAPTSLSTAHGFDDAFEPFRTNKKDKRTLRHYSLLHKVRERKSGIRKKVLKRGGRRPGKKLGLGALGGREGGMGGLGEALPGIESAPRKAMDLGTGSGSGGDMVLGEEEWGGVSEDGDETTSIPLGLRRSKKKKGRGIAGTTVEGGQRIKLSSVRHKPGAARRKAVMEGLERERMGRNLAGMSSSSAKEGKGGGDGGGGGVGERVGERDRWAALRRFIGGTMEMREVAEGQA